MLKWIDKKYAITLDGSLKKLLGLSPEISNQVHGRQWLSLSVDKEADVIKLECNAKLIKLTALREIKRRLTEALKEVSEYEEELLSNQQTCCGGIPLVNNKCSICGEEYK